MNKLMDECTNLNQRSRWQPHVASLLGAWLIPLPLPLPIFSQPQGSLRYFAAQSPLLILGACVWRHMGTFPVCCIPLSFPQPPILQLTCPQLVPKYGQLPLKLTSSLTEWCGFGQYSWRPCDAILKFQGSWPWLCWSWASSTRCGCTTSPCPRRRQGDPCDPEQTMGSDWRDLKDLPSVLLDTWTLGQNGGGVGLLCIGTRGFSHPTMRRLRFTQQECIEGCLYNRHCSEHWGRAVSTKNSWPWRAGVLTGTQRPLSYKSIFQLLAAWKKIKCNVKTVEDIIVAAILLMLIYFELGTLTHVINQKV